MADMNKEDFLSQCEELRPLMENILKEVDKKEFRYKSGVVKPNTPEYRLYCDENNHQFCQITALKQKKCLKVEIKRPCPEHLSSIDDKNDFEKAMKGHNYYFETSMKSGFFKRNDRRVWQRFYVSKKERDIKEIIHFIKQGSKDWMPQKENNILKKTLDNEKEIDGNELPDKPDCNRAIKEIDSEGKKGTNDEVLDRIEKNDPYKGSRWHPDWRKITLKNMKKWSC